MGVARRQFLKGLAGFPLLCLPGCLKGEASGEFPLPPPEETPRPEVVSSPRGIRVLPPTGQKILDGSVREGVFMHTGTHRPESGMFGNTRRDNHGRPRFHEGIDIAPLRLDPKTRMPLDDVCAAADGRIVYVNRYRANPSLYGNYLVLLHDDPDIGAFYSLYAHLVSVAPDVVPGVTVAAGHVLGRMGNIPDIPVPRAHLHLEFGMVMSIHYARIDASHGIWNGANLYGFDPCDVYTATRTHKEWFSLADYLAEKPVAFAVELDLPRLPDYFRRYPALWKGMPFRSGRVAVGFSAEGIPLVGQNSYPPPPGEKDHTFPYVLWCDMDELKKGRPYVAQGRGYAFSLTNRGQTLLKNLLVDEEATDMPEALDEIV